MRCSQCHRPMAGGGGGGGLIEVTPFGLAWRTQADVRVTPVGIGGCVQLPGNFHKRTVS